MRPYPLEAIRSLRAKKEEETQRKLAVARVIESQKRQEVKDAEKALANYLTWMKNEADRLFSTIIGSPNPIHKVTDITNQISWNRTRQSTYVVALDEARKKLQEAEVATANALKAQENAYKEAWKINEHHKIWMQEEMLRDEQAEEADLEEVAATIFAMHHALS